MRLTPPFNGRSLGRLPAALLGITVALAAGTIWPPATDRGRSAAASEEPSEDDEEQTETSVFLPTDRLKERQLDIARSLIKDARWSDAATLLDEILAADRDFFFQPDAKAGTWRSVKAEAGRLVQELPAEGAEAYSLQYRARADRVLRDAIGSGDQQAIVAVAHRWMHTPAGQKATLIAALEAFDAGQPLAAAAWLDRLAAAPPAEWKTTLAIMRAIAWLRAGDETAAVAIVEAARKNGATAARIGGREVAVSFPAGGAAEWLAGLAGRSMSAARSADEWTMHRGEPARNALVSASRPLLVPRFRVPLTRHPEEARWLESRRKRAADQDAPLLPAAMPLAVGGTVVVHTPMGLLAIDFTTGKRLWLRTGGGASPVLAAPAVAEGQVQGEQGDHDLAPVFDDATSGVLSSDGRLVFAVESPAGALVARDPAMMMNGINFNPFGGDGQGGNWSGGNSLVAYDLSAKGAVAWRLPAAATDGDADGDADGEKPASSPWYMGAPLPMSGQLFVLVEEAGEVRLDVLEARSGRTLWSQPLAELDEDARIENLNNGSRRVAGLSPSLAEGVLVCPTGAGAVVAVDLATRTLLWAYNYQKIADEQVLVMPNGMRVFRAGGAVQIQVQAGGNAGQAATPAPGRWIDQVPVLAAGRVLLTPGESAELHCLDLRSGSVAWKKPRGEGLTVAGVVDGKAIIVGRASVEAVAIDSGRSVWSRPVIIEGRRVSGRPMLTAKRLFVPIDSPEVAEIDVASGALVGRSAGRGGSLPGNLVAYRGEVLSQGVDSLDVFHQLAPLEAKIETASTAAGEESLAWAAMWRGQVQLDRGDVAAGIASLQAAIAAAPMRVPPDMLAEAMVFAMGRDPSFAARSWRDIFSLRASPAVTGQAMRLACDALLAAGNTAGAWEALRGLLDLPAAAEQALVEDTSDRLLMMSADRWIRGRLATLLAAAPAELQHEIETDAAARRKAADQLPGPEGDATLAMFIERFGNHPLAVDAGWALVKRLDERIDSANGSQDAVRSAVLRRDFALIELRRSGGTADRERAGSLLDAERRSLECLPAGDRGAAWPLGRVAVSRRGTGHSSEDGGVRGPRVVPLPITSESHPLLPGIRITCDMHQPGLLVSDGLGRRLGGLLGEENVSQNGLWGMRFAASAPAASLVGRVVVVRAGTTTTAYDLARPANDAQGPGQHRRLWSCVDDDAEASIRATGVIRVHNQPGPGRGDVELGERGHAGDDGLGLLGSSRVAVQASGVPVITRNTLQFRDASSGAVLWERHRLPSDALVFGDDDFLCVAPQGPGQKMLVLSTADGRLLRTGDMPDPGRLLVAHGRFLVVMDRGTAVRRTIRARRPGEPTGADATNTHSVSLEVLDAAQGKRVKLGNYSGRAWATMAGPATLAVVEPHGRLTLIDLAEQRVAFSVMLPEMPPSSHRLSVVPWQDRYMVTVSRRESDTEAGRLNAQLDVQPLQQQTPLFGERLSGSIWAVERTSGEVLWQVPATVLRHFVDAHQPPDLPVLVLARLRPLRSSGQSRLSVLCLDKRTGHAVYADDDIPIRQGMLFGCEVAGDPEAHSITIAPVGGGEKDIVLSFTGEPIAPQHPFQASQQTAVSGDFAGELKYWFNRAIAWPTPF